MATERDAATAEDTVIPAEEEATEESETDQLRRERDDFKRKYNSERGRVRKFEAQAGENAESETRMSKFFIDSMKTFVEEDDPKKRMERLLELGAEREASHQMSTRVTSAQVELDKLVSDSALDWDSDPDLADARQAWQDSKPEDALRLASLLVKERSLKDGYVSNSEVDEIVATQLKNARQNDSVVDPGASTAAGGLPTNKPKNAEELVEYLRLARQNNIRIGKADRTDLVRGAGGR